MVNNPTFDHTKIWGRYLILEEEFLKFMKYVPLNRYHSTVTSPYLDDLHIRTCSLLESFFKAGSHCKMFDMANSQVSRENLNKIRNNPKFATIGVIESVFNQYYNLSPKEVHFIYQGYKFGFFPYQNWSYDRSPNWWQEYNSLKHNGFKKSVNYETVLYSLGALFLAIVTHADMLHYLAVISVIDGFGIPRIEMNLYEHLPQYENTEVSLGNGIVARSSLFGYIYTMPICEIWYKQERIKMMFTPPFDPKIDINKEREWIQMVKLNQDIQ